jgi:hypothetical protein
MKGAFHMLISFKCPHCQALLKAGSSFAGKTGGCPKCGKEVRVPEQNAENKSKEKEAVKKE